MAERRIIDVLADRRAAASARRHVTAALEAWDLIGLRGDAELVVSELMTNALVHASAATTYELHIERLASGIRLAVADHSASTPVLRDIDNERIGGRGLLIVQSLSSNWGYDVQEHGKQVWAELRSNAADPDEQGPRPER